MKFTSIRKNYKTNRFKREQNDKKLHNIKIKRYNCI